jgi:hypothetical protein
MPEAPFPICLDHATQVYSHLSPTVDLEIDRWLLLRKYLNHEAKQEAKASDEAAARSVVYYVRLGAIIKIGYSSQVRERMVALQAGPTDLLATEPGDSRLEAMRHKQFADLRIGRREHFRPEQPLLDHIEMIRDHFGAHRSTVDLTSR